MPNIGRKFTPGEWAVEYVCDFGHENPMSLYEVVADGRVRVCENVLEADAHLIAAAKDLLDAADLALHRLVVDGHEGCVEAFALKAAISKARGGA